MFQIVRISVIYAHPMDSVHFSNNRFSCPNNLLNFPYNRCSSKNKKLQLGAHHKLIRYYVFLQQLASPCSNLLKNDTSPSAAAFHPHLEMLDVAPYLSPKHHLPARD